MSHIAAHRTRMYESTARSGREATTKKRKRRQRYTLRYFLNSPSQAVYIPRWLCVLQSYALRRESHPSGFFARRVSLDVISQTTGSPREMAVSVVRYLALLVFFCALLQYRKYWDSTSAAVLAVDFFLRFSLLVETARFAAFRECVLLFAGAIDMRSAIVSWICKERQIKRLKKKKKAPFAHFRYSFLPVYFYKINIRGKSNKNESAFLILLEDTVSFLIFSVRDKIFFVLVVQEKKIFLNKNLVALNVDPSVYVSITLISSLFKFRALVPFLLICYLLYTYISSFICY